MTEVWIQVQITGKPRSSDMAEAWISENPECQIWLRLG